MSIPNGEATTSVVATIVPDSIPEVDEAFIVRLVSIQLASDINGGREFNFAGDTSLIDSIPQLGPNTEAEIVIQKNDDANGVVSVTLNQFTVQEGDSAMVQLSRTGGTFAAIAVSFTITPGTALGSGIDFSAPSSPMIIPPGVSSAIISIPIIDDTVPEFQESFSIMLTGVGNGGRLGDETTAVVIIDASDNPTGRVRFSSTDVAGRVVDNPSAGSTIVSLTVERQDGTNGIVEVELITIIRMDIFICFILRCSGEWKVPTQGWNLLTLIQVLFREH